MYTPEGYVAEEAQLETSLTALKGSENISDEAMRETMKDIEKLSELYVSQDVLQYKVKKGFEAFEDRLVAICDPLAQLSELLLSRSYIHVAIESLQDVVKV